MTTTVRQVPTDVSTDTTGELAAHLRLAVTRLARRMRQEAGGELSPSQAAALATVVRHEPLTPSELADRERIRRPTATRVLALLEERALVVRQPDPEDRRSALVSATPEGRRLLRRLRTRKTAYLSRLLRGVEPDDLHVLADAATIMERLLTEEAV